MSAEYIGGIKLFAGNFAIVDYAFCSGQLVAISQNNALFALIGTQFGGDGVNTFALPDLRSRVPIGQGQGVGLTGRTIGQVGGSESVTLSNAQLPAHTHALNATTASTTSVTPGPTLMTGTLNANDGTFYESPTNIGFTATNLNANAVAPNGSSLPHSNIQPSLAINYLIALFGVFPSRN
jgi:microcystin-dependent protein